ncbi:MAG TPA: NAD(P)H-binding protein [Candidatus Nitrosotalea sp.]|nr:NAD(P)H-binding protein [Candidatus Nitrosotalea sp.]
MHKVAISGASGFVGKNVGRFLAQKGFDVVALVRKKQLGSGKFVMTKDLSEKRLPGQLRGCSALLHLIGLGRQTTGSDYETVNVDLTRNAVRLCKRAGIRKIIYLSGLGADSKSTLGYFISKFKAEREIIASGLDYTIFRPSYIMGRGDALSTLLLGQSVRGSAIIPGSGRYRLQPIFVNDVAQILAKAIGERQFSRKVIDLVGPKTVSYSRLVADLVGKTRVRHIDFERAHHDALVSQKSPFGVDDLSILVGDYLGDHKRLAKISRIKFTEYGDMLQACRLA